jgi:hypothetical protein
MAKLFSIKPAMTLKGREFRGLRGWAGKPLHPPLTDFPIVCYLLTGLFDVISYCYGKTEHQNVAHDFFVAATALSGFWDWWKGMDRDRSRGL